MSTVRIQPQVEAMSATSGQTLSLPVVQFLSETPGPIVRMKVFYSAAEATAAIQRHPDDAFYDVRGRLLTPAQDESGSPRLERLDKPAPSDLHRRSIVELREAAARAGFDATLGAEAKAAIDWLAAAPGAAYMVQALGLAESGYGTDGDPSPTLPKCASCTTLERLGGKKNCCPHTYKTLP